MNILLTVVIFSVCAVMVQCVWVKEMENDGFVQGDIVLDPDEHILHSKDGSSTFASIKGGRWPNGRIPYLIENSIGSQGVRAINYAIASYHRYTCLRFHKRTNERTYISFYKGNGCHSLIGYRQGRVNRISLASGCQYMGIVMHEIGHSVGFWHEQMRPDRDNFITIVTSNIQRGKSPQFEKLTSRTIDSLGTPYDFSSMMHYGSTAFSIGGGRKTIVTKDPSKQRLIGRRTGFSEVDKRQLGLMYNNICKGTGGGGGGGGTCGNKKSGCVVWARRGWCSTWSQWMHANCCGACKGVEDAPEDVEDAPEDEEDAAEDITDAAEHVDDTDTPRTLKANFSRLGR